MVPTNGDHIPKFVSPSPPPEGIERELLTILAEECCEVGQRVSKALRFGSFEIQPGQSYTNLRRIELELGDVLAVFRKLESMGLVHWSNVEFHADQKAPKLEKYLQSESF